MNDYWGECEQSHTSKKSGMSIAIKKSKWKYGLMSVMCSQKFTFKNRVTTYKCFWMFVHHVNNYQSSLLTLYIRLVCAFLT